MADAVESALAKYEIISMIPTGMDQTLHNQMSTSPDGRFVCLWSGIPAGHGHAREARMINLRTRQHWDINILAGCRVWDNDCAWVDSTTFFMVSNGRRWGCIYRYSHDTDSFDASDEWNVDGTNMYIQGYSNVFSGVVVGSGNYIGRVIGDPLTLTFVGMVMLTHEPDWWFDVCTVCDNYISVYMGGAVATGRHCILQINDWDSSWTLLHTVEDLDEASLDIYKNRVFLHQRGGNALLQRSLPDLTPCGPTLPHTARYEWRYPVRGKFCTTADDASDVHTVRVTDTATVVARYLLTGQLPQSYAHQGGWLVCCVLTSTGWDCTNPELFVAVVRMLCTECCKENREYDGRWDSVCRACKRWKGDVAVAMMRRSLDGGTFPPGPDGTLLGMLNDDSLRAIFREATKKAAEEEEDRDRRSSARLALLLF